jgi:hypothetical protein
MKMICKVLAAASLAAILITGMWPLTVLAQGTNNGTTQQPSQATGSNLNQRLQNSPAFQQLQNAQQQSSGAAVQAQRITPSDAHNPNLNTPTEKSKSQSGNGTN